MSVILIVIKINVSSSKDPDIFLVFLNFLRSCSECPVIEMMLRIETMLRIEMMLKISQL